MESNMSSRKIQIGKEVIEIFQDLRFGHAGSVWDAALVLTHYFIKNAEEIKKKFSINENTSIVELGSGTGFCGIVTAALYRPQSIILTDLQENINLIQYNIQKNQSMLTKISPTTTVQSAILEWGRDSEKLTAQLIKDKAIDLVVGSDLTYDQENTIRLFETLDLLYEKNCKLTIILSYTLHKESDDFFIKQFSDKWNFQQIKQKEMHRDFRSDDIFIVILTRKSII